MIGLERDTVKLEPYQAGWKDYYEDEVERLKAIEDTEFLEFEHIGSTAIKGMPAKPIIDILAVIDKVDEATPLIPSLEDCGYEYRPDDVDGRLFFAKGPCTNRTYYLSITEQGSTFYEEKIAFREYFRAHPDAAEQYALLKNRLAGRYPENRERYTAEKDEFIRAIIDRAMNE